MNRWLLIGSLAGLMALSTGCLRHQTRGGCSTCGVESGMSHGGCQTGNCGNGNCGSGDCGNGNCGSGGGGDGDCGRCGGMFGKARGCMGGGCNGGRTGCQAGPLGWQQGGLDYSSNLNPGFLGHNAGQAVAAQPFTPGPPQAQVAYPYYTHRGPRDFLNPNPPSIGP